MYRGALDFFSGSRWSPASKRHAFWAEKVLLVRAIWAILVQFTKWLHQHRRPQAWARGGTCSPIWKCKVFLCRSTYSKTLSRQIIWALFSQPVIGFWGLGPRLPPGLYSWTPLGDFRPQTPNLPTPRKNPARPCASAHKTEGFWWRKLQNWGKFLRVLSTHIIFSMGSWTSKHRRNRFLLVSTRPTFVQIAKSRLKRLPRLTGYQHNKISITAQNVT